MIYWIKNNKLLIIGIAIGAIAGFVYWQQIGCASGTCMITSKWHNSTAYGAIMGGLIFSMFKKSTTSGGEKSEKENE
jgi:uncharacterized protein YcfJ